MRFEFKPSFDRSVKNFHGREREKIKAVALVEFILAGDHDDMKRYLRSA